MKKLIIYTSFFFVIDLVIKGLIIALMNLGQKAIIIPGFFKLWYLQNEGAAFSLFDGWRYILVFLAVFFLFYLWHNLARQVKIYWFNILVYSLLMAGVLGNALDRIFIGRVIDYLSFSLGDWQFAVFNLSDTYIVIGVILYAFALITKKEGFQA